MKERVILHCDMNNFFASVELLDKPELRNLPVAVCGDPKKRHGIILAKNSIAKKAGVKTPEPIWQAKKKCPNLICISPHMEKYSFYSKKINEIYNRYTDLVEPFSIDESWLDVTASQRLFGDGVTIANSIRNTVKKELSLTLSAGVSFNKIFAKMGSEYKKPDATTLISKDNYKDVLWPLPVSNLFFAGRETCKKLVGVGIVTIGDLATADPNFLTSLLGKQGNTLYIYANGLEDSKVAPYDKEYQFKSVSHGITFERNISDEKDIRTAVTAISDYISQRLRCHNVKAKGIKIDIKDPDFNVITRQIQLDIPTDISKEIMTIAFNLLKDNYGIGKPIRLITVAAINLCQEESMEVQLDLFAKPESEEDRKKLKAIDETMDTIRNKFGRSSIGFASTVNNDLGINLDPKKDK